MRGRTKVCRIDASTYADARFLNTSSQPSCAIACSFRSARSLVMKNVAMVNVFSAGQELVRWEVTAISDEGPYRLSVTHAGGAIVEYFQNVAAALQRERELEVLFRARRLRFLLAPED